MNYEDRDSIHNLIEQLDFHCEPDYKIGLFVIVLTAPSLIIILKKLFSVFGLFKKRFGNSYKTNIEKQKHMFCVTNELKNEKSAPVLKPSPNIKSVSYSLA